MILTHGNLDSFLNMNRNWVPIDVSETAYAWIVENAKRRARNGDSRGWRSKTEKSDSFEYHLSGMASEWSTYVFTGIPPARITSASSCELNEGDHVSGAVTIESKSSPKPDSQRWSLVENERKFPGHSDRVYLHSITALLPKTVIVTGWAYGREILEKGERRDGYSGKILVMPRHFLRSPHTLHVSIGIQRPKWLKA